MPDLDRRPRKNLLLPGHAHEQSADEQGMQANRDDPRDDWNRFGIRLVAQPCDKPHWIHRPAPSGHRSGCAGFHCFGTASSPTFSTRLRWSKSMVCKTRSYLISLSAVMMTG